MNFPNIFKRRQSGQAPPAAAAGNAPAAPNNTQPPLPGQTVVTEVPDQAGSQPKFQAVDGNQINLVMYSPDAIVAQVRDEVAHISFGSTASQKYKHIIGDIWANIAPWVLCIGTILEVFLFVWSNTDKKIWQTAGIPSWVVMCIVFAGIISMEATFATVSLKTAAIREDGRLRPGGPTDEDKAMVKKHMYVWIPLAIGVSLGQIAFLVGDSVNASPVFIVYAVLRVTGTMYGDAYTAFFHVEGPTDEAKQLAADQRRAKHIEHKLQQKNAEMNIVNEQVQSVMRAQNKGEMELDKLRTELAISKQENETRIETMQSQAENAKLMTRMGNNLLRAAFDDQLSDTERERIIRGMMGLLEMNKQIPPPTRNADNNEEV